MRTDTMVIMNRFLQDLSHDTMQDLVDRSTSKDQPFTAKEFFKDLETVILSARCRPEEASRPFQTLAALRLTVPICKQLKQHLCRHFQKQGVQAPF